MAGNKNTILIDTRGIDGTSPRSFHATGVGEYWRSPSDTDQQEDIFTRADFGKDLKKVSRKIKKQLSERELEGTYVMKNRLLQWVKSGAKYYIWAFGILLVHLAVITHTIAFPDQPSTLIILLFIFDAAWLTLLISDIRQTCQQALKRR